MVFAPVLSLAIAAPNGPEIIDHRLIDEDVAVGKKEDAFLAPGLPQAPDNLKCGVGLAGAGGHDEQDSVLALGNRFYRGIDGIGLVVAGRLCRCRLQNNPAGRSLPRRE